MQEDLLLGRASLQAPDNPIPVPIVRSKTDARVSLASIASEDRRVPMVCRLSTLPMTPGKHDGVFEPSARSGSASSGMTAGGVGRQMHSVIGLSVMSEQRAALDAQSSLAELVNAMDEWRSDFLEQRESTNDPFWHRKSKKIVLAIVALKMGDDVLFVRGCNLEVSMPSGSLCAERNAIGTALTMYPGLGRADFRGVAVLSLTGGKDNLNPLPPCGVCSEWLEKIQEVNPDFRVVTFSDQKLEWVHGDRRSGI